MARSRRCIYCTGKYWPDEPEYERCPNCREPTVESFYPAMPPEKVEEERRLAEFGWWLYDHDRV